MSMGYGELEANNEKHVTKVQRKSISLKLKRDSLEESNNHAPVDEPPNQAESLNWNFKVKLAGEKKTNKENLLNFCEKCKRPILIHGRLIPCKHFLCLNCAQKGTRNCFKCETPIKGIQPVPKIYVCAHEGTRHSLNGCRKSYLNFVGLDQHQKLRHSGDDGVAVDSSVDSDGELSVNKQHAAQAAVAAAAAATATAAPPPQPQPQQQPHPAQVSSAPPQFTMTTALQPTSMASLPPGAVIPGPHPAAAAVAAAAAAAAAALSRPVMFHQMQPPRVAQPVISNATRLTFANASARPTAVILFPRPQLAVTSMAPLLVPPRGLGAPQMLTLPGMLPQPAAMMPMPHAQFQTLAQHVPGPVPQQVQPEPHRPHLPTPPSMPMPEQMRENGPAMRDTPPPVRAYTPPVRDYTPPVRSEVPAQLREGAAPQHYSPSHDTPPPPPPRNMRPDQRSAGGSGPVPHDQRSGGSHDQRGGGSHDQRGGGSHDQRGGGPHDQRGGGPHDPRDQSAHDPRRGSDHKEQSEFRGYNNRESTYPNHEYDAAPRDPRKARDIPPPPPPRNGNMR